MACLWGTEKGYMRVKGTSREQTKLFLGTSFYFYMIELPLALALFSLASYISTWIKRMHRMEWCVWPSGDKGLPVHSVSSYRNIMWHAKLILIQYLLPTCSCSQIVCVCVHAFICTSMHRCGEIRGEYYLSSPITLYLAFGDSISLILELGNSVVMTGWRAQGIFLLCLLSSMIASTYFLQNTDFTWVLRSELESPCSHSKLLTVSPSHPTSNFIFFFCKP